MRLLLLPMLLIVLIGRSSAQTHPVALSAGYHHAHALLSDGSLWSWGQNAQGQVGNGVFSSTVALPVRTGGISSPAEIVQGLGYHFNLVRKADGTLQSWGFNGDGELGNGLFSNSNVPVAVLGLTNVVAAARGGGFSVALKSDGTVWTWGENYHGQLGNGTFTGSAIPTQITSLSNIVAVAAGTAHALALRADGTVWAWGFNVAGQLGNFSTTTSTVPVQVIGLSNPLAIRCGGYFSMALMPNHTLVGWGANWEGQLGFGPSTVAVTTPQIVPSATNVVDTAHGEAFSLILFADGTLKACGSNDRGQIGDGTTIDRAVPAPVTGASGIVAIACGGEFAMALRSDGTILEWGANDFGGLGDGTTLPHSIAAPVTRTWPLYGGTYESLQLGTGIGAAPTFVPNDQKNALAGQILNVSLTSPGNVFSSAPAILAAEIFPTGSAPGATSGYLSVHIDPDDGIIVFPATVAYGFTPVIGPLGIIASFVVPANLAGLSVMLQGFAISASAENGLFAAGDAHEIRFL